MLYNIMKSRNLLKEKKNPIENLGKNRETRNKIVWRLYSVNIDNTLTTRTENSHWHTRGRKYISRLLKIRFLFKS